MEEEKKEIKGFSKFLHNVFVHNFGYKVFSLIFGALIWACMVVL
jgi:hypothetical protein